MRKPIVGAIAVVYLLAWFFAVLPVTKLVLPFALNEILGFNFVAAGLTTIGLIFVLTRGRNASKESKDDQATKDEIVKGHRNQFLQDDELKSENEPTTRKPLVVTQSSAKSNAEAHIPVILTRRYKGSIAIQDLELIDEHVEESR